MEPMTQKMEELTLDFGYAGQGREFSKLLKKANGDVKEAFSEWVEISVNRSRFVSRIYGLIFFCNSVDEVPCRVENGKVIVTIPKIIVNKIKGIEENG
jgi:hypothetical protein